MSLLIAAKPQLNRLVMTLFFSTLMSCTASQQQTQESAQPLSEQTATPSLASSPPSDPIILVNPTQSPAISASTPKSSP